MTRVVLVTGAAGGVGRAIVGLLSSRGDLVLAEDLDERVRDLESDGVAVVTGDVSDPETARVAIDIALARFGRLDGLVNNAARFELGPIGRIDPARWDELFAVNVRGAFLHLQAALPHLEHAHGSVVNVTSVSGLVGFEGQFLYSATKGALVQMTRAAAIELAPAGVRVNAVAPGTIDTPFMDEVLAEVPDRDDLLARIAASHPRGSIASPAEVAEAIAFLLSPAAAAITGVVLPVDGGITAQ